MARKHRITNVLGLGSLPLTPRENVSQPRLGLKKFTEEYNREQQAAKEAPQRALDAELREEFRLNAELIKNFFSLPMAELDKKSPSDAPLDFAGNYPLDTNPDRDQMIAARNQFLTELSGRGVTLSPEGATRFGRYVGVLVERRGIEVSVAALFQALDRCYEVGIFAPGEITGYTPAPQQPVPQAAAPQPESIDHLSTENREQRAEILRIVGKGWSTEFTQWFLAWTDSLRQNFNYEFPIHELGGKAANFLERHNLSPFIPSSWDKIRVNFVQQGYFPDALLTPSERLASLIENSDMSNREVRIEINRRQREINEAAQRR